MTVVLVIAAYLATLWLNVMALRGINVRRLQFIDGILLGLNYYVLIPFAVILLYGRIGSDFLRLPDYLPYQDLGTTVVVIVGSATICLAKLASGLMTPAAPSLIAGGIGRSARIGTKLSMPRVSDAVSIRYIWWVMIALVALDLSCAIAFFYESGIGEGGHWYHASSDLMAESSTFLLVKHVGNFSRTAVFGAIAILANVQSKYRKSLVGLAAALAIIDLFLTFNRITVVYFLIVILLVSWRHIYLAVITLAGLLFSGTYLSTIWPEFRGQVSSYGYSIDGMSRALAKAIDVVDTAQPFVDQMNGMFESVGFSVLNFIVRNQQLLSDSSGSYIVRPLTVLIPRSIWPDRPNTFALEVGSMFSRTELAVNSYLFGEPYANSWLYWPLLLLLLIAAFDSAFRWMSRKSPVWGGVGALIGFAWWRFDSSIAAASLVFSIALYAAFLFLPADAAIAVRAPRRRSERATRPLALR